MNKYIYDNCDLIKISDFDSITFECVGTDLVIVALKVGNEKDDTGKLLLEEVDIDFKYTLENYINNGDIKKNAEQLVEELFEEFINFIDSDKNVFRITDNLESLITEYQTWV